MPKHPVTPPAVNTGAVDAMKRAMGPVARDGARTRNKTASTFGPGGFGEKGRGAPGGNPYSSMHHRQPVRRTGGFRGR